MRRRHHPFGLQGAGAKVRFTVGGLKQGERYVVSDELAAKRTGLSEFGGLTVELGVARGNDVRALHSLSLEARPPDGTPTEVLGACLSA